MSIRNRLMTRILFTVCIAIFFVSCRYDGELVEPSPIIFIPSFDALDEFAHIKTAETETGFLWPPRSCDILEGRLPIYRSEDGSFELGGYGRFPDSSFDQGPELGGYIRITFKKPLRTIDKADDSTSEYKYIGVIGGTYFKGYPFEGITDIGGIVISGLPYGVSLYEAKIRFAGGNEINVEIKSVEEIIPSLTGASDFSQVAVIVPTDSNVLASFSGLETSLDFIFWFKVLLEDNRMSLFDVDVVPLLIDEEQEYRVTSSQRIKLARVSSDEADSLSENPEIFTFVSDDCLRIELSTELVYFNANYNDDNKKISFEWESGIETDNAGFNIWCAKKDLEKPFKINDAVIESNAISFGNAYYSEEYLLENFELDLATEYCVIETINNNGLCDVHCDFITEVVINSGNKHFLGSNSSEVSSEVKFSCDAHETFLEEVYGAGICLERLLGYHIDLSI